MAGENAVYRIAEYRDRAKASVKELIQHDATAENLAAEVKRILTDKAYAMKCEKT